jgi:hypothetical protein
MLLGNNELAGLCEPCRLPAVPDMLQPTIRRRVMNWQTRIGFRILFWIADHLVSDAVTPEQRETLRAIAVSFGNGELMTLER